MRPRLSLPVLASVLLLPLAACGGQTSSGAASSAVPDLPLSGVRWSVDAVTVDGRRIPAPAGAHLEVTDEGRARGDYGCNRFGAQVRVQGDTVTVSPGEATEKGCAADVQSFEDGFRALLTGALTGELADDRLTLTDRHGDQIALSAAREPALVGTEWTVTSLVEGESAASLPEGTRGTAVLAFAEDGTAEGSLGCNRFTADARITGDSVVLGPVAATRKLCDGPGTELERALTAVLESGALRYRLEQGALTLTAGDGTGLVASADPER
ncbi:META domain-containing protein [Streptomyces sanyensis]|uniref:META domain-containing protein n=1 Tax=Streptomyces sanyensis TaxID=568869 RepID=UPI003D77F0D9